MSGGEGSALRILVYTHGGPAIGAGHVVRCLALVEQAHLAGHEVTVAGTFDGAFVRRQLAACGARVVDLPASAPHVETLARLQAARPVEVLHVDRYDVTDDLRGLAPRGSRPLVSSMEDGLFGRRRADVSFDPTLGSEHDDRSGREGLLLRGVRFAPLRRQVLEHREGPGGPRSDGGTARVLVLMGGTDARGLTGRVLDLLGATGLALRVTVVVPAGAARPSRTGSGLEVTVVEPTDDVAALMSRHDLAVSAAGTTVVELMCLGVPAALVLAAENQRAGYERVLALGAAVGLGSLDGARPADDAVGALRGLAVDGERRRAVSLVGQGLVDGLGAWRIVSTWEQLVSSGRPPGSPGPSSVRVRAAGAADAGLLLGWRNDHATRAASRDQEPVAPEDHRSWLSGVLASDRRHLLVGEDARGPVGTVRWDRLAEGTGSTQERPQVWEVSITVAPDRRGEGLAGGLLDAGERWLRREVPAARSLLAAVRSDNLASRRVFVSAGWTPERPSDASGVAWFVKQL